jgi:hypothetical protein
VNNICRIWASEPESFILNSTHQTSELSFYNKLQETELLYLLAENDLETPASTMRSEAALTLTIP